MTTIIILLPIYIISAYAWYKLIQHLYYGENAHFKYSKPAPIFVLIVFLPVINTLFAITWYILYKLETSKIGVDFFKPKNKL